MTYAINRLDCEANSKWSSFVAVEAGGVVVGVCEVVYGKDSNDRSAYIQGLFVAEPHRRNGVARALLRDAIASCRGAGRASAYLQVGRLNTAAISLYESAGFFPLSYDASSEQHTYVIDLRLPAVA